MLITLIPSPGAEYCEMHITCLLAHGKHHITCRLHHPQHQLQVLADSGHMITMCNQKALQEG